MQRAVDDFDWASRQFGMELQFFHLVEIGPVELFADEVDEGRLKRSKMDLFDAARFLHDSDVVGKNDLRAVFPIDFVAVVLRWIVGGCDHNGRMAAEIAAAKGDEGCGAELFREEDLDAVAGQNAGCLLGEFARQAAHIVADEGG